MKRFLLKSSLIVGGSSFLLCYLVTALFVGWNPYSWSTLTHGWCWTIASLLTTISVYAIYTAKPEPITCPSCGSTWTAHEIQTQNCFTCGWPKRQPTYPEAPTPARTGTPSY